ncbi:MAG: sodium:solute symporter family protein [Methanospirillum sp.]|nr:sodium:solute symporter family protein [Methanospirillum sp.]
MAVDIPTLVVATALYLAATIALGYFAYRQTKTSEDYLIAGRKRHPAVIALSYGATFISTSAIVGFGGVAANLGMGMIWLTVLNIGLGVLIAFAVFGRPTRRLGQQLGAVTFPDLMGKRYGSPFMQYGTGLVIVAAMPLYTAAILIGGARFIETTLGISYTVSLLAFAVIVALYVVYGGLIAVMYTDAFQGLIMLVGMSALLVLTYIYLGGVGSAHRALDSMTAMVPASLAAQGHLGWTSMPALGSPIWFTLVTTLVLGVGIGVLAQPQLVVRFMCAKDDRTLDRAVTVGGPFLLMMTGVAFTAGALTNVWFQQTSGTIAVTAAGGNIDAIIPLFINQAMPDLFIVIFMLTLLSAAMSTLASLFHAMGSALVCDVWSRGRSCGRSVRANQIGCLAMMVVSIGIAFLMPGSIIARATAMFMGLCASAFLPVYAMAVLSKRPELLAAKASFIAGAGAWLLWTVFVHAAEAVPIGISQALLGVPTLLGAPWNVVDPLVVSLPLSTFVIVAVQALCQPLGTPVSGSEPES